MDPCIQFLQGCFALTPKVALPEKWLPVPIDCHMFWTCALVMKQHIYRLSGQRKFIWIDIHIYIICIYMYMYIYVYIYNMYILVHLFTSTLEVQGYFWNSLYKRLCFGTVLPFLAGTPALAQCLGPFCHFLLQVWFYFGSTQLYM